MMKQEDLSNFQEDKLMPGNLLKAAREAQDISIEAVSKYLHLTVPTILSIEADYYEKMPAPVYVRGYLRRYAQFVKLDPEEILNAFEQNIEIKSKILEEIPSYAKRKPITSSHVGFRFLTYILLVVLLILVGLWIHSHEKTENPTKSAAPQPVKVNNEALKPKPVTAPLKEVQETKVPKPEEPPVEKKIQPELKTEPAPVILTPEKSIEEKTQNMLNAVPEKTIEKNQGSEKEKNYRSRPTRTQPTSTQDLYY